MPLPPPVHLWLQSDATAICARCGLETPAPAGEDAAPCRNPRCTGQPSKPPDHHPGCSRYQGHQCRPESGMIQEALDEPMAYYHRGRTPVSCRHCRRNIEKGQPVFTDLSSDYEGLHCSETCLLINAVHWRGHHQGYAAALQEAAQRLKAVLTGEHAPCARHDSHSHCSECSAELQEYESDLCRQCAARGRRA